MELQQVRNLISYYLLELVHTESIPNHITRDVIEFNRIGKYCGEVYRKIDIMEYIHNSTYITQINSVPQNSICMIDNKRIPSDTAELQLIVHSKTGIKHLILQKTFENATIVLRSGTTWVYEEENHRMVN